MLVGAAFFPLINSSSQAIWQAKVAPPLQGRVFTARRLIAWLTQPVTPLIAGTLADYVMEPAMGSTGRFAQIFSGLVGSGPGAGMGLLTVFCCLACMVVGLSGYCLPAIRDLEATLPDHDQLEQIDAIPADQPGVC
jgi:DHA3 family macrolide efflux protein-like MFS transporter